ncbi:MAG: methylated-DNA--[Ruminococcus sp.]|nr:methylated-DNA--[protein]-cysteine S-methyltransferase [Ruminococcus sp.]
MTEKEKMLSGMLYDADNDEQLVQERFDMEYTHHYVSPLGGITIAADGTALIGLWFDGQKYFADALDAKHEEKPLPIFEQTDRWLDIYFSGKAPDFTPPLNMKTTEFRKAVWEIMLTIPYGKTMTYGEIADRIAKQNGIPRMSAQAVGGAVGHNSISLIIPCHRVVGTNGSLTGYAGGIDKKVKLLEMEGADMDGFFVPKKGTAL